MIYTSYFSKAKNLSDDYLVVGITRFPPDNIKNCFFVAPSRELLGAFKNNLISKQAYTKQYLLELNKNQDKIIKLVDFLKSYNKENNKHVVLCCYEKSQDFCHRHILSKYLKQYGLDIKEL